MSQLYLTLRLVRLLALVMLVMQPMLTRSLKLSEYITEVVESNPVVREQVHSYRQVAQDYRIALAGWRPSLDLEATTGRFSREAPNTAQTRQKFSSSEATLTLTQNLFAGFDTTHEIGQAQILVTSAAYRLYDTADNVALQAIQAYFNSYMADVHYEHMLMLPPRESEIARDVAQGLSNKRIANVRDISESTVKTHLTRIFRKLHIADRTSLAS